VDINVHKKLLFIRILEKSYAVVNFVCKKMSTLLGNSNANMQAEKKVFAGSRLLRRE
jgi:hypothetical protein